jgi:hypothetical protein
VSACSNWARGPATSAWNSPVGFRPGGLLVLVEAFPDPDRQSVATLRDLVESEGFTFEGHAGTRWRDVVRFRRQP